MATQTVTDTAMDESARMERPQTSTSKPEKAPITVSKPTPYTFDLAHLLAHDPNPLPPTSQLSTSTPTSAQATNTLLTTIARDGAQTLLNQLLTTCPIQSTPDGLTLNLPQAITHLPRWKHLPKPKAPTKWESFARKKGIGKFGGNMAGGGAKLEERKKNVVFDEETGEWVKKWGFKGGNKKGEGNEWLVELDDKKTSKEESLGEGQGIRGEGKRERMERVRRQERRERNNERRGKKGGGRKGV